MPGSASGACRSGARSPWPLPFAPRPPPTVARLRSGGSPLLWQGPTSRRRASSARAPCLPDADQTASACGQPRDLPVPAQGACAHARVSDRAGSSGGSQSRHPPCCLPLSRRRRHPGADFRGSMAGLCDPLSTLRHALAGRRRMIRGQCGCRVEVPVTRHLPHRSHRAAFPQWALVEGQTRSRVGALQPMYLQPVGSPLQ